MQTTMIPGRYYKLDNPVWFSLTETQKPLAIGNTKLKRYQNANAPFVAFDPSQRNVFEDLDQLTIPGEIIYIINHLPNLPKNYTIEKKYICPQMVYNKHGNIAVPEVPVKQLTEADDDNILALINEVFPGFYVRGTRLMGDYFGIFDKDRLVSISGERMRMDGFTEISAVVTHPDYAGRKYAQRLVMHFVNKNLAAGITPFLHTEDTNSRAIKIYEHLGFTTLRNIDVWKIKRFS